MGARTLTQITAILAGAILCGSIVPLRAEEKPSTGLRPNFAATLRLDRTLQPESLKSSQPLSQRSLPALLLSPGQWREVVREFSEESKAASMHFYWTGQPMTIERNNLYYARSSLSYTKGIILKELAHNRMDFGLYKGRVTLEQNRIYGMGAQPVSNPILGNDIRFFRNPIFADVDKVFVMVRFHLTRPRTEDSPPAAPKP